MPIEGAVVATIPDLISVPLFGFSRFYLHRPIEQSPQWILTTYGAVHNWIFGVGVTVLLYIISPITGILMLGYLWHIIEDAPLHTKMATQFLWPVWKGRLQKYSAAEHKWVQVVDLVLIALANVAITYVKK